MDHKQIDQYDLIDRYLLGKLPAEEIARFEEHFVDCPQCVARLQATKTFLQDLRFIAAEQASQAAHHSPRRLFRHIWQARMLALAVAGLLIAAIVGIAILGHYTRRLRAERGQAQSLSAQLERRYEDERQTALAADSRRQEAELQLAEQQRTLEAKLKDEQAQRAKMAAEFSRRMPPDGNLTIFGLAAVRGGASNAPETGNQIALPRASPVFAFSIPLEGDLSYATYRITILDHRQRLVWMGRKSPPDQYNSLAVLLRCGLFRPGHYALIVKGAKKGGGEDVVGHYPFVIVEAP